MPAAETAIHYVLAEHTLYVGRDQEGRPLAYRRGDVLPPDEGAALLRTHPAAVTVRPGPADASAPHLPDTSGVAVVRLPESQRITAAERAEFAQLAEAAGRRAVEEAVTKLAGHDRLMEGLGVDVTVRRDEVEARAADKAARRAAQSQPAA